MTYKDKTGLYKDNVGLYKDAMCDYRGTTLLHKEEMKLYRE